MGLGGGFGRAIGGALKGYASSGNYYGAAAGAAAGYLDKPEKKPRTTDGPKTQTPADLTDFKDQRPKTLDGSPNFLQTSGGLSSSMTPVQQRAQIATQATGGESSAYRDPEVLDYYRNLALMSLTHPSGSVNPSASILPIEREYLTKVLGGSPRNESTQSFLSALLRV